MKHILYTACALLAGVTSWAQSKVIPAPYTTVSGNASFTLPFAATTNPGRTYQLLIDESLLTGLLNRQLNGISFRQPPGAASSAPAGDATFSTYDIYLGKSVPVANHATNIYSNEAQPPVLVRSGSYTIPANAYPPGGPTAWSPVINFDTPYTYTGGPLLVEIRYPASSVSITNDALSTSTSGYGTQFAAHNVNAYTPSAVHNANAVSFAIPRLSYVVALPLQLLQWKVALAETNAVLQWTVGQVEETHTFSVERSMDGSRFVALEGIPTRSTDERKLYYCFVDTNVVALGRQTIYYRLRFTAAGETHYSAVAQLALPQRENVLVVAPNPVADFLTVVRKDGPGEPLVYRMTTPFGTVLQEGIVHFDKKNSSYIVEVGFLSPGTYLLSLSNMNTNQTLKFTKE